MTAQQAQFTIQGQKLAMHVQPTSNVSTRQRLYVLRVLNTMLQLPDALNAQRLIFAFLIRQELTKHQIDIAMGRTQPIRPFSQLISIQTESLSTIISIA